MSVRMYVCGDGDWVPCSWCWPPPVSQPFSPSIRSHALRIKGASLYALDLDATLCQADAH
eukprot:13043905-Heterocapsa_arctica.AAC.1